MAKELKSNMEATIYGVHCRFRI